MHYAAMGLAFLMLIMVVGYLDINSRARITQEQTEKALASWNKTIVTLEKTTASLVACNARTK